MRTLHLLCSIASLSLIGSVALLVPACSDDTTTTGAPDASSPTPGDSGTSAPAVTCETAGVALCGGACVSTATDPRHCGGCNKACAATEACAAGACVAQCTIEGKTYASDAVNPASSCEACTPGASGTAWSPRADGTACNPGQLCKAGACAPRCFIGGVLYDPGAVNPANSCEVCMPATSTTAFTPRATVPLLVGGDDVTTQGWTIGTTGSSSLTYGADYVRLQTSTNSGASTSGHLLLSHANAVDPAKPFKVRVTLQVESTSTHNQYDAPAAIMGAFTPTFGSQTERGQMVYLDSAAIGWADDTQSAAFAVTDGTYHVYELAVDAAKVATLSVDGVAKLTRNGFVPNGTIAVGDQTNDANVDSAMRIKSVERVCP